MVKILSQRPAEYGNLNQKKMSKDKGSKNHKKAPADKSAGKQKVLSAYKSEGKSGHSSEPALNVFSPKPDTRKGGSRKP